MDALEQQLARQLDVGRRREDPAQRRGVVRLAGVERELEAPGLRGLLGLGQQPPAAGTFLGMGKRVKDQRAGFGQRLGSLERVGYRALEVEPLASPAMLFGGRLITTILAMSQQGTCVAVHHPAW